MPSPCACGIMIGISGLDIVARRAPQNAFGRNDNMKKIVLVVLVSALLMTACGKKHTQITEKLQDQTEHVESVEEEETKTDQELLSVPG